MIIPNFTPTQERMMAVLADGLPHSRAELHTCLYDELGRHRNVHWHLTGLRRRLRSRGEDVLCCIVRNRFMYRRVRLIGGENSGDSLNGDGQVDAPTDDTSDTADTSTD